MTEETNTSNSRTFAASTLNAKSRDHDDIEIISAAINRMLELNDGQRTRHLDLVRKILDAAATGKGTFSAELLKPHQDGAGVGATTNRRRGDKTNEEVEQALVNLGFNEDALPKAAELFYSAVEARLMDDPFQSRLAALLQEYCLNPWVDDLDVVELLAAKVLELEEEIAEVEAESATLAKDILNILPEEINSERSPKRSSVNNLMCEGDETNADALFNEQQVVGDARMRNYLQYFSGEE